jgi:ketosteroid isomerase-like protein
VSDPLTAGDGQDVFAHFKRALEKRDPEAMLELFADDAEYRIDPFVEPLTGANAIRGYWNDLAADRDHVDFDAERVWVVGRTVLASWHGAYTRRRSAERVRMRGFSTIELDMSLRISRMRDWPVERMIGLDSRSKPDTEPAAEEKQDG